MTGTWPTSRDVAEQLFGVLSGADHLTLASSPPGRAAPIPFGRLYRFVTDPASGPDHGLREALREDPRLCQDLDRLLENTALCRFPRAAAASTGEVNSREEQGFRITLHPSRADPRQLYLLIRLHESLAGVPRNLIVRRDGAYEKHALPEARDGVIQLLTEEGSPLVRAVRDIDTEIFLS